MQMNRNSEVIDIKKLHEEINLKEKCKFGMVLIFVLQIHNNIQLITLRTIITISIFPESVLLNFLLQPLSNGLRDGHIGHFPRPRHYKEQMH